MKKLYLFLFAVIFILGIILRFYELGRIPNSLNWDEVSWGYNAYSVFKTGHDEHGVFMPLSFKAFGDFKQPVYVYLTSFPIGLFGLTAFAARFPSAFLGSLTIPFVWLLVFELFKRDKHRYLLSLLSMLFFVISPWSIQFSRVAYEANVGLFFVVAGVALFLRGLNEKKYYFNYVGIALLSISGYSYHSEKIFTPVLFIALLIWSYFSFHVKKKFLIICFILFLLGNLLWILDTRTTARGRSVTFVSNQTQILKTSAENMIFDNLKKDRIGSLFHNRRIVYFNKYLDNYLSHFNPNQLFVTGDSARHHAFGVGILYLASLPFILLGMVTVSKKKYWFIFAWLMLAPVASALAIDAPNASRSLIFLPTWHIFEALGIIYLWSNVKKIKTWIFSVILIIYLINFVYYLHNYFSHTNSEYGIYWQSGYKEAMLEAYEYQKNRQKVIFSPSYEQPYIFYLFYSKYDPATYIANGGSKRIQANCFSIDVVYFGKCNSILSRRDIFISQNDEDSQKFDKIKDIKNEKGSVVGHVYQSL